MPKLPVLPPVTSRQLPVSTGSELELLEELLDVLLEELLEELLDVLLEELLLDDELLELEESESTRPPSPLCSEQVCAPTQLSPFS